MPKPIKWASQIPAIRERVTNSVTQTWARPDIEWAFEVKRVTAQELMLAIGETETFGSQRFVDRGEVLSFLDEMEAAEDIRAALDARKVKTGPQPRRKRIRFPIPEDAKSCTMMRLPEGVELSPLKIVITGSNTEEILTNLYLLGQAFLNDPVSMESALELAPQPRRVQSEGIDEWLRCHELA
jgi:hypothetical protein